MKKTISIHRYLAAFSAVIALQYLSAAGAMAQSTSPLIGILSGGKTWEPVIEGLKQGMERLGYKQNKNINYLVEDANGEFADLVNRAKKLIDAKVDVLYAVPTAHSLAAMKATSTVPVVYEIGRAHV